jgi:DNA-binding winged helix-turn-helix (wHTH) protein/tetratricopeptide (TPR) repeat protein
MARSYRFGDFELDGPTGELRHRGRRIALEPKAFDVLAHLVRHRDRAVGVEELLAAVWSGVAVERGSVHRVVRLLRRALAAQPLGSQAIATLPRRGYRFTLDAQETGPGALGADPQGYVGRSELCADLDRALSRALRGHAGLILLYGPAGIGKSATLARLARSATRDGAVVFEGRCSEGPALPPHRPWSHILRAALHTDGASDLAEGLALGLADVARALPEIGQALGVRPPAREAGEPGARYRMHAAIADWLRRRCRRTPVVLLLDDLHRADPDSLELLASILEEIADERLLVAAAYRDAAGSSPGQDALARLVARHPQALLRLGELTRSEVAALARARSRRDWLPGELDRLSDASGGNPLFVEHLVRARDAGEGEIGADLRGPGLRGVLRRLMEDASPACSAMLAFACVFGREFEPAVVAAGLGLPLAEIEAAVSEAVGLRLVERAGDELHFVHGLIPEVLYAELPAGLRLEQHRRAVTGLLAARTGPRQYLSELAHHACEAADRIGADVAFDHTVRAARDAARQLAYDNAIALFRRALSLRTPDAAARAACLVELATWMVVRGAAEAARAHFAEACELARELDDPILFARSALGPSGVDEYEEFEPEEGGLLREALDRLGDRSRELRVRLLIALARTGYYGDAERTLDASAEALAVARASGEPACVCAAGMARAEALGWTLRRDERRALVREADEIARREPVSPLMRGMALRQKACEALLDGDRGACERCVDELERLARARGLTIVDWRATYLRGTLALLAGRFDDARDLVARQLEIGRHSNPTLAFQVAGVHTTMIELATGSLEAVTGTFRSLTDRFPELSPWRAALALALAQGGQADAAREHAEVLVRGRFEPRHRDFHPAVLASLAEAGRWLGERALAATLAGELAKLSDPYVVLGPGLAACGAADRYRGLCAETLERYDEAIEWYEGGLALEEAMGAHPFVARTLCDLGRALRLRGHAQDAGAACRHRTRALELASKLGLLRLAAELGG